MGPFGEDSVYSDATDTDAPNHSSAYHAQLVAPNRRMSAFVLVNVYSQMAQ